MYLLRTHILRALPALQKLAGHCTSAAPAGAGQPTVQLHFETLADQIRVADAQPEPSGSRADPRATCAAQAMKGATLPAPSAVAGSTFRMPITLDLPRPPQ